MTFDESQLSAIDSALNNKFHIIAGGAGTGKTTIVTEITNRSNSTVLCAPTGKAAARLREATGQPSRTIHSTLRWQGKSFMLESLAGHHIIVDESSMVDAWLMASIIKLNPDRVTLVGDNAQLPPVGPGEPFHDLIRLKPTMVSELNTCYRSSEAVCAAGNKVREGVFPGYSESSENEIWSFNQVKGPDKAQQMVVDLVRSGEIDFEQDIVICPRNGRTDKTSGQFEPSTVKGLNPVLRGIVNPSEFADKFDIGDRVICTVNFAKEDVWNGTTGTVESIDTDGKMFVRTDVPTLDPDTGEYRDEVLFDRDMVKATDHAYALTIHKAQGSQYRKVIVLCLNRDSNMLTRSLLYTAITRAQKECMVIGERWAFDNALNTTPQRKTVMKELAR